jgi:hypothetical protein
MKSSQKVISPLTENNPGSPLPSTGAKKSPANSEGRQSAQPSPSVQNAPASERKLPDNWSDIINDPILWAELRDIILGSNED